MEVIGLWKEAARSTLKMQRICPYKEIPLHDLTRTRSLSMGTLVMFSSTRMNLFGSDKMQSHRTYIVTHSNLLRTQPTHTHTHRWGRSNFTDATSGQFPRNTKVVGNFVHEIGHIQKQSSFYFQAITAEVELSENIVFNIPRAAINFNDGAGGGANVHNNLLFNTCRESSDHGAFNSWYVVLLLLLLLLVHAHSSKSYKQGSSSLSHNRSRRNSLDSSRSK